jgi:hypothetical protein
LDWEHCPPCLRDSISPETFLHTSATPLIT